LDHAGDSWPVQGCSGDLECLADTLLAALNLDLYTYQRGELGMDRERIVGALHALLDGLRASR
jgi:hypothetical protein